MTTHYTESELFSPRSEGSTLFLPDQVGGAEWDNTISYPSSSSSSYIKSERSYFSNRGDNTNNSYYPTSQPVVFSTPNNSHPNHSNFVLLPNSIDSHFPSQSVFTHSGSLNSNYSGQDLEGSSSPTHSYSSNTSSPSISPSQSAEFNYVNYITTNFSQTGYSEYPLNSLPQQTTIASPSNNNNTPPSDIQTPPSSPATAKIAVPSTNVTSDSLGLPPNKRAGITVVNLHSNFANVSSHSQFPSHTTFTFSPNSSLNNEPSSPQEGPFSLSNHSEPPRTGRYKNPRKPYNCTRCGKAKKDHQCPNPKLSTVPPSVEIVYTLNGAPKGGAPFSSEISSIKGDNARLKRSIEMLTQERDQLTQENLQLKTMLGQQLTSTSVHTLPNPNSTAANGAFPPHNTTTNNNNTTTNNNNNVTPNHQTTPLSSSSENVHASSSPSTPHSIN